MTDLPWCLLFDVLLYNMVQASYILLLIMLIIFSVGFDAQSLNYLHYT